MNVVVIFKFTYIDGEKEGKERSSIWSFLNYYSYLVNVYGINLRFWVYVKVF